MKIEEHDEALALFEKLVAWAPNCLPTYCPYEGLLHSSGREEEAVEVPKLGVRVAGRAGDDHTRSELLEALRALE